MFLLADVTLLISVAGLFLIIDPPSRLNVRDDPHWRRRVVLGSLVILACLNASTVILLCFSSSLSGVSVIFGASGLLITLVIGGRLLLVLLKNPRASMASPSAVSGLDSDATPGPSAAAKDHIAASPEGQASWREWLGPGIWVIIVQALWHWVAYGSARSDLLGWRYIYFGASLVAGSYWLSKGIMIVIYGIAPECRELDSRAIRRGIMGGILTIGLVGIFFAVFGIHEIVSFSE